MILHAFFGTCFKYNRLLVTIEVDVAIVTKIYAEHPKGDDLRQHEYDPNKFNENLYTSIYRLLILSSMQ